MKPNISEFSYGFAITSELVQDAGGGLVAAPVFPSLYQEGQTGGGWDVRLDRPGVPLFLQFKLSDCMVRATCRESRDGGFNVPCYRMNVRKRPSRQHEMLFDLETSGAEVYYVAPAFHEPEEFNDAFLSQAVRVRSLWVRPLQIGPITDSQQHHVSFEQVGQWAFFSKPTVIDGSRTFEDVSVRLARSLEARGDRPVRDELPILAHRLIEIAEKHRDIRQPMKDATREQLAEAPPIRQLAHYASMFLECQFVVVQERATGDAI